MALFSYVWQGTFFDRVRHPVSVGVRWVGIVRVTSGHHRSRVHCDEVDDEICDQQVAQDVEEWGIQKE